MPTAKITKRSVDAADVGFLWDQDLKGFGLKTTASGAKSYVFQYRMGGRETHSRRFTIGTHGSPWTPATAREEAERLAILVKRGVDPQNDQRQRRRENVDLAFETYADRFLERYVKPNWAASYVFAESILRLHVKPALGRKSLPSLTRTDISELLDRVPDEQVALRRNIYAVVRRLVRWALARGDILTNPLEGFEAPAGPPSRERVLNDEEIIAVWRASETIAYPFGTLVQLLLATGQRREEVAGLKWDELDRNGKTWTLPGTRSKNGRTHLIPLSNLSILILDRCGHGREWPRTGFVFTTTGRSAVSGHSKSKRRIDQLITGSRTQAQLPPLPAWRVHDLRRTLATGFQILGTRFEVTEAVLNHQSGARAGVAGIYQRHDWADEKRAALEHWGRHLNSIVSGGDAPNVVPIRRSGLGHQLRQVPSK